MWLRSPKDRVRAGSGQRATHHQPEGPSWPHVAPATPSGVCRQKAAGHCGLVLGTALLLPRTPEARAASGEMGFLS